MGKTLIEWTDRTWNPTRGCSRISQGCVNCYAERQAARFAKGDLDNKNNGDQPFHGFVAKVNGHASWTGKVELIQSKLLEPLSWKTPARIFVNSMSDLFHESLPDEDIDRVFAVMALCPQHTFQILTKRPKRMEEYFVEHFGEYEHNAAGYCRLVVGRPGRFFPTVKALPLNSDRQMRWPLPNVHLGVSVEDQDTADARIPLLLSTPAAKRFVSYEPALGPVDFGNLCWREHPDGLCDHEEPQLDQIIIGGESGTGARPFDLGWARQTIAQCKEAGVACFVKQLGARPEDEVRVPRDGYNWKRAVPLKDRKGGDMSEWSPELRVRELI